MANGHLSISLTDGKTFKTAVPIYFSMPASATITQALTELARIVTAFNLVTAAKITRADGSFNVDLPSANDPAGSNLDASVGLSYPVPSIQRNFPLIIPAAASGTLSGGDPDMSEDGVLDTFADILEVAMATTGTTAGFYGTNQYVAFGPSAAGFLPERDLRKHLRSKSRKVGA